MVGRVREEPLGRRRQRRRIKKISSKVYGRSVDDPLDAHGDTLGELCLSSVYPANACTVVAAKRVCRGTKRGAALGPPLSRRGTSADTRADTRAGAGVEQVHLVGLRLDEHG